MDSTYGINAEAEAWLGIDPGVTTGWALIDHNGVLVGQGDLTEPQIADGLDQIIRGAHRAKRRLVAVIEKMPPGEAGELADVLTRVRAAIDAVVVETYELPVRRVRPGEWKTSRVAKIVRWPDPFKSDHARDAATMALYAKDWEKRHGIH